MRAEKLDTQNGMANRRNVCQAKTALRDFVPTLRSKATPITALMPSEFSQIDGDGSK